MKLSVGLGKISNDAKATILTRKALGRLTTPGVIVSDEGLTINNKGQFSLRMNSAGGITESETGFEVVAKPNSGVVLEETGFAAKLKPSGGFLLDSDGLSRSPDSYPSLPWTRFLTATGSFGVTFNGAGIVIDYTMTVPGAVAGDCVILEPLNGPKILVVSWSGFVSAANTVKVRYRVSYIGPGEDYTQFMRAIVIGF